MTSRILGIAEPERPEEPEIEEKPKLTLDITGFAETGRSAPAAPVAELPQPLAPKEETPTKPRRTRAKASKSKPKAEEKQRRSTI